MKVNKIFLSKKEKNLFIKENKKEILLYLNKEKEYNIKYEDLYRYINDIKEIPKCKICGKEVKFKDWNRGYGEFCSVKCRNIWLSRHQSEEKRKKISESVKRNHWVKTRNDKEQIINRIQTKRKDTIRKNKLKNIKLIVKHYKYKHSEETKRKIRESNIKTYIKKRKEILNKIKTTQKERYGDLWVRENQKTSWEEFNIMLNNLNYKHYLTKEKYKQLNTKKDKIKLKCLKHNYILK